MSRKFSRWRVTADAKRNSSTGQPFTEAAPEVQGQEEAILGPGETFGEKNILEADGAGSLTYGGNRD